MTVALPGFLALGAAAARRSDIVLFDVTLEEKTDAWRGRWLRR
jgi:hypothetical protein